MFVLLLGMPLTEAIKLPCVSKVVPVPLANGTPHIDLLAQQVTRLLRSTFNLRYKLLGSTFPARIRQ